MKYALSNVNKIPKGFAGERGIQWKLLLQVY